MGTAKSGEARDQTWTLFPKHQCHTECCHGNLPYRALSMTGNRPALCCRCIHLSPYQAIVVTITIQIVIAFHGQMVLSMPEYLSIHCKATWDQMDFVSLGKLEFSLSSETLLNIRISYGFVNAFSLHLTWAPIWLCPIKINILLLLISSVVYPSQNPCGY